MPVQWQCPGHPQCMKSYVQRSAMKAHQASCDHAQNVKVVKPDERDVMANIVHFAENEPKGNITMTREDVPYYKTPEGIRP